MYLVDQYVGPQAGTEGQLLQLVQHLDRSRYEPSMTVFRNSEYVERNLFPCPVRVLGITKLASLWTIFRIVGYVQTLRRENYRLVHCFFNDSALIAPIFLKLFGIRVLVSRRDMGFWYTPRNLIVLRLVVPFVDRYVANSNAVRQYVQQQERIPDEKITVIYNGYAIPTDHGSQATNNLILPDVPDSVPDSVPVVGIVANLKPIKRIETLVEAFALASKQYPDARLLIVGDTASMEGQSTWGELNVLARRLGVLERIIFTGRVKEPMPYIKRFTVAVLCSESEGFSNSIIEYMQVGCPVICTDAGGNSELIQDNYNGFLVPVGNISILVDRIVRLLSDRALARRLGQAGYETVRSYTHTRMVTEQMACYDHVLYRGPSGWGFCLWTRRV